MGFLSNLTRDFNGDKWWKLYVKAHSAKCKLTRLWYTYRYMKIATKGGGYIGRETVIQGKPKFPHGFHGVHISRRTTLGSGCTILQNTTIGSVNGEGPTIGNNVLIGANAVIVGKITIGDKVKIGAGAIVVNDVPSGSTIVGTKAKIVQK